jgi:hypothetical protein
MRLGFRLIGHKAFFGVILIPLSEFKNLNCHIFAISHKEFKALTNEDDAKMFENEPNDKKNIVDVKGVRNKNKKEIIFD